MTNNQKTPELPGGSLFGSLKPEMRETDTPPPAAEAEEIASDAPIEFTTAGLPDDLEIVKAPDSPSPAAAQKQPLTEDDGEVEELAAFVLGESTDLIRLESARALRAAALSALRQADRELLLVTPDLEEPRYDNAAFVDALSGFVRSSKHTVCRILIGDPTEAIRYGHKLVPLLKRLSSRIEVRQLHEDDRDNRDAWMVLDGVALLRCTDTVVWRGGLSPRAPAEARRCRDQFHQWWERAAPIPDFRDFRI